MNQGASKHATITQKAIFRRSLARAITAGCRGCRLAPLLERPSTNFNWVMVECPSHGASFNHSLNDALQKGNRIRLHAQKRGLSGVGAGWVPASLAHPRAIRC